VRKAPHLFAQIARRFDLSLVQQSDPEQPGHENVIITAAIFDSGRPVLIVPYIQTDGIRLNRVMICWDGTRNAARYRGRAALSHARESHRASDRRLC
jgi:hypothetical protein